MTTRRHILNLLTYLRILFLFFSSLLRIRAGLDHPSVPPIVAPTERALAEMRREVNWLCVVLFCTDAHALQAPALRRPTVVATSHRSGLAGPVAVRTPHVVMVSPGWRIAAVTTGASSVVSTVVAVREWRGRRRAMRQVGDLNATVLSLKTDLQLAAKRQKGTQAALTRAREKGEAARVYGMQMADALEREQTARRAELVFKAKEARELAAANYERQRELQAVRVRVRVRGRGSASCRRLGLGLGVGVGVARAAGGDRGRTRDRVRVRARARALGIGFGSGQP